MRPLIRNAFAILLCLAVLNVFAGNGSARPIKQACFHFGEIIKLDSLLSEKVSVISVEKTVPASSDEAAASGGRICSCQILNLESSNYDHRYVVLLAEKINDGSSADFSVAKNRIQKEKKHLKQMFYDKVKVVAEMHGTGSCKAMFFRLKTADSHLQLYEILNADID
ncbi:MAG TPA: hypothetical protein VII44_00750 [Puia sp.]